MSPSLLTAKAITNASEMSIKLVFDFITQANKAAGSQLVTQL